MENTIKQRILVGDFCININAENRGINLEKIKYIKKKWQESYLFSSKSKIEQMHYADFYSVGHPDVTQRIFDYGGSWWWRDFDARGNI